MAVVTVLTLWDEKTILSEGLTLIYHHGRIQPMLGKPISWLKSIKTKLRELYNLHLISRSELFDKTWYVANNSDVAQSKMNPALHYLLIGGFDGRDPSPNFQSKWYLETYKDVRDAKTNPLVHFIKFGRREGRLACCDENIFVDSTKNVSIPIRDVNQTFLINPRARKIFCVGYNKTGTTSIGRALEDFGYKLGDQSVAEQLMDDWAVRNFKRIVQYCESADAFQDLPFSVDFTYQILDYAFPESRFILTVRSNADEWYDSLIRFYQKIMKTEELPTADDMKKFPYGGAGWFWRQEQNIFGVDESTVCDEIIYKTHYSDHNKRIQEYFKFRPKDLLVLNLSNPESMRTLCAFLEIEYKGQTMPHLNKSRN